MTSSTAGSRAHTFNPLTVTLLPPSEAYDYEHVANRLLDPELLAGAVAIRIFRIPLLAVPVGGRRRGGTLSVASEAVGTGITDVLSVLRGFPDVRLTRTPDLLSSYAVEWGEAKPDDLSDDARSLFYGFHLPGASRVRAVPPASVEQLWLLRNAS